MKNIIGAGLWVAASLVLVSCRQPAPSDAAAADAVKAQHHVISAGEQYVLALDRDGRVFAWGNAPMRVGTQPLGERPRLLLSGSGYRQVSAGHRAIYALDASGALWRADLDELGSGAPAAPQSVSSDRKWQRAFETWGVGVGIDAHGALWYWQDEDLESDRQSGTAAHLREPRRLMRGVRFVDACVQNARLHAVDDSGRLWRTLDLRGHPGAGPLQGTRSTMQGLSADSELRRVYCRENASQVLALDTSGRLYGYGGNTFGELGIGEPAHYGNAEALQSTRLQPISDQRWGAVAVGPSVSFAIARDGSLWGWGRNLDNELGNGDTQSRHAPALIDDQRRWVAITAAYGTGIGLTEDGELYAWGENSGGVLGDGGVARTRDRPTAVLTEQRFGAH
jgi:alpha-tubulin suppressor-like RCC1 family protein